LAAFRRISKITDIATPGPIKTKDVGNAGREFFGMMCHVDDCRPSPGRNGFDQLRDTASVGGIEAGAGLVEKQEEGIFHHGPRDHNHPFLSERELTERPVC
jgi:hypothetical protein